MVQGRLDAQGQAAGTTGDAGRLVPHTIRVLSFSFLWVGAVAAAEKRPAEPKMSEASEASVKHLLVVGERRKVLALSLNHMVH